MQVSVRDLKNHLSKYLHELKMDEPIIITSHQTPIAKLTLIPSAFHPNLQDLLQAQGMSWNGKKPAGGKVRPKIKGKTASEYVLEDRR